MIEIAYKVVAFLVDARRARRVPRARPLLRRALVRRQGAALLGRLRPRRRGRAASGRDRTEWALSAIPLGGYVKMADEREGDVAPADLPRAFNRQSVWKRIAIVAAGPIANLLLAVLLFAGTFIAGIPGAARAACRAAAGTPAAAAGIREGDLVVAVDGEPVRSWQDLRWRLLQGVRAASDIAIDVERPDGARAAAHACRSHRLSGADWEGNFMPTLGLRTDLGPPLIDEALPGKPAAARGTSRPATGSSRSTATPCARRPTSPR